MNEIHGRFVPTFYWENHEPMEYWYDSVSNSICVDCNYEKKLTIETSNLNIESLNKLLDELEDELIVKYNLLVPKD